MSLKLPEAPQGTKNIVNHALQRAHKSGRFAFAVGAATPVAPHPVYTIGQDELVAGGGVEAAKFAGWRSIILQGDNTVAAVEFAGDGTGLKDFKSVNQGPYVQSTASAIAVAENLPQAKAEDFELRLLQLPSIYVVALWLHGRTQELFIPLKPAPRGVKPESVYSGANFFKLAGELARQREELADAAQRRPRR